MKYIKIVMVWCVAAVVFPSQLMAQNTPKLNLNPVVQSNAGQTIQGAIVTSKQDNYSAVSDSLGVVRLQVTSNTYLLVEAPGYETKIIQANPELDEIILYAALEGQDVKIAFQTKDRDRSEERRVGKECRARWR